MCGICGWISTKRNIDYNILEKMNNVAKYRGPDDEGYLIEENNSEIQCRGDDTCKELVSLRHIRSLQNEAYLALAHRRLSILDLSPMGHQPMLSDSGNSVIFNGEIYNYIEIRKELETKGYLFNTKSDTEVLLAAYDEWGEKCTSHLNGMWAFAIWDKKNNILFCSRDRLGAKPFYYYLDDSQFIFASEIKQICQNTNVQRKLNLSIISSMIIYDISDYSEETFVKDIHELRGGYNLIVRLNSDHSSILNINKYKYWDLVIENNKIDYSKSNLSDILENSIKIRTRSDVPIGVLLSGGVDSSCLVAALSEQYKRLDKKIDTYTSCYKNFPEGDEIAYAKQVNEICGTNAHYIYPDEQDTFEVFKNMIWHMEGNTSFSTIGSFLTLKQISSTGVKVLLNGQGSDETMLGYERYYAYYLVRLLKEKGIKQCASEYSKIVRNSKLSAKSLVEYMVYFSNSTMRKNRCINRMKKYLNEPIILKFKNSNEAKQYLSYRNIDELQYGEIRGIQLTHILRMDDRSYMAFSMESRVPYIDYRYIEEAMYLSVDSKIHNGYTKYCVRKMFENRLPESVIWRRNKMGWPSPQKRWVERFDKEKVLDLFTNARSRTIFNIDELKKQYLVDPSSYPVEKFMIVEQLVRMFDLSIG